MKDCIIDYVVDTSIHIMILSPQEFSQAVSADGVDKQEYWCPHKEELEGVETIRWDEELGWTLLKDLIKADLGEDKGDGDVHEEDFLG